MSLLIATDLDGCLLDEDTYSHAPARVALEALRLAGVPLVVCTSKTRAEVEPLSLSLGLGLPFIVENGGALVIPSGLFGAIEGARREGSWDVLPLGAGHEMLVQALEAIAAETGVGITPFSSLDDEEVRRLTGVEAPAAARQREYDEPFLMTPRKAAAVARAAAARGLDVTRGGRFYHLSSGSDKGRALLRLLSLDPGPRRSVVALGDAPNDLPLLEAAERPIIVPRKSGLDPDLARSLPEAEVAPRSGPAGWAEAVLAVLAGRWLTRVFALGQR